MKIKKYGLFALISIGAALLFFILSAVTLNYNVINNIFIILTLFSYLIFLLFVIAGIILIIRILICATIDKKALNNVKLSDKVAFNKTIKINGTELFVNTFSKQFYIKQGRFKNTYNFSDLKQFDINNFSSNKMKTKVNTPTLIIGIIMAALTGYGAYSTNEERIINPDVCTILKMIITINDPNKPKIIISFIKKDKKRDSEIYKLALKRLDELTEVFEYIKNNA